MKNEPRLSEKISFADGVKMIFAVFLWALCFPLIKVGLSSGSSPLLFGALRTAIAFLFLLGIAVHRREPFSLIRQHKLILFAIGVTAFIGYYGMVLGGANVNSGLATVISNSNPIVASLFATIFLSEFLNLRNTLGLILGFAGVTLIAIPSFKEQIIVSYTGIALVGLAAIAAAGGNILLKRVSNTKFPISIMTIQFGYCSLLLLLAAIFTESPLSIKWDLASSGSLVALGIGGTALSGIIWIDLLNRNSLIKLNVFIFLTPAFSLVLGAVLFKEKVGWWEMAGIGLILVGVYFMLRQKGSQSKLRS
jgi:drug/metabolite transporter (DMT)-like permease